MSWLEALAVLAAGLFAGTINTVVGSGSLVTFPVLLAIGLPPVTANVSNNIGILPGSLSGAWGYRDQLRGAVPVLRRVLPACLLGGAVGALLLLVLPGGIFTTVVVVLIALALLLVLVQPRITARLRRRGPLAALTPRRTVVLVGGMALASLYGGYFGAAQGVIYLAILSTLAVEDLQQANGVKNVAAACVNGVAAVLFVVLAEPDWAVVGLLAAGSVVGGLLGARVGRRLPPAVLRGVIVVVGVTAIANLLLRG